MAGNSIDEQITSAIAAHAHWKARLRNAIKTGESEFEIANVQLDTKCEFGSWLYAISAQQRGDPHYSRVRDLHAKVHVEAARVLGLALGGHRAEAEMSMEMGGPFTLLSSELTSELVQWR